jgi:hypothetical protein
MTSDDDAVPSLGEETPEPPRSPLRTELDPVQLELLDLILFPMAGTNGPWPVWDYVSRELGRQRGEAIDAGKVLRSLPTVPVPGHTYGGPYGLVWRSEIGGDEPLPDHRVGLTIAGLDQLARDRKPVQAMADGLAGVIGWLADREQHLPSDPDKAAEAMQSLEDIASFVPRGHEFAHSISKEILFSVLQKEYVTISILQQPEIVNTNLGPWLRPYRNVTDAASYLDVIALDQVAQRPSPQLRGDELALMLDYASFVLASREDWDAGHMAVVPDLRTAASLSSTVTTEAGFKEVMSDLATILQRLKVPKPSQTVVDEKYNGEMPGSLVRLQLWLGEHITDPAGKARAHDAIEDIRSINAIRNDVQHPSRETRKFAARALARLNIPDPIRNWGEAWEIIRARVADAFDAIRQEAQP